MERRTADRGAEEVSMKKQIVRLVVMLAASAGLVALVADAAYARIILNHCEPTR
jgi:hypothetical protein